MAYEPQQWEDLPAKTTPFSAERMLHIENGVEDVSNDVANLAANIEEVETSVESRFVETGSVSGLDDNSTPRFTRLSQTPAITAASIGQSSIFWPSIIRAADYLSTPIDTYYMYVSTDHGTAGGIFLLTSPSVEGPWTPYGQVFVDVIGQQTETPDVQFVDGKFDMLYQQQFVPGRVANQVTLRATSPDGVNWTRIGIAIDLPVGTALLGEYHTGYQRRNRIGNRWMSQGLAGGSIQSKLSPWFSNDGKTWKWSGELNYGSPDLAENTMRRIDLNGFFTWRGRTWGYGRDTNSPSSGGVILEEGFPVVGPVTNDWFSFASVPSPALVGTAGSWENSTDRGSYVYVDGSNVYMFYQKGNSIGIAKAEA